VNESGAVQSRLYVAVRNQFGNAIRSLNVADKELGFYWNVGQLVKCELVRFACIEISGAYQRQGKLRLNAKLTLFNSKASQVPRIIMEQKNCFLNFEYYTTLRK